MANHVRSIPDKVVGRLSLYRSLLQDHAPENVTHLFSHDLARMARVSAAQVRRDLMDTGYIGSPNKGYEIKKLVGCISRILDNPECENVALIGVGHLGRAIIDYFQGRRSNLCIVAAFDNNPSKVNRIVQGVKAYPISQLQEIVENEKINTAIVAVPGNAAQGVADQLVQAGIRGILNLAPTPLYVPENIYLVEQDMTMSLEKVAYFARRSFNKKGSKNE